MRKIILLSAALFLVGCQGNNNNELSKQEQEAIYREEVQKSLKAEEKEEEKDVVTESEEKSSEADTPSPQKRKSASEQFDSLPKDIQMALLIPYYDERGEPDNIIYNRMSTSYGIEGNIIFLQVHSGAGSGHPVYKIQRQGDTFQAVDGVAFMGHASGYEDVAPPTVQVTVEGLMTDYEKTPDIYDMAAESTSLDLEYLTSDNFEMQKNMVGQSQPDSDSHIIEEELTYEEYTLAPHYPGYSEYLFPSPIFINGELYSGEKIFKAEAGLTATLAGLEESGYEVYVVSHEEYNRLEEAVQTNNIPDEEVYSYYLSNFLPSY